MEKEHMNSPLHLALRYRPRTFEQVAGQPLAVRILRNTLYKNYFLPVYLFTGRGGCGKTSVARIFAAASNCEQLPLFQKNPQEQSVPCLRCTSCKAMEQGTHPDFIEIDAASHTGVDNVREIIESSSFLPTLGTHKIYLIDEAHMLSKAAFNAFLKVLEEPPRAVFFILATTDMEKIIETVHSRCLKLFFSALDSETLVTHLAAVCDQEKITYQPEALQMIALRTEGLVRDAITMIDQLNLTHNEVSCKALREFLGAVDVGLLSALLMSIMEGRIAQSLQILGDIKITATCPAADIWKQLVTLVRNTLFTLLKITDVHIVRENVLQRPLHELSYKKLERLFELLYIQQRHLIRIEITYDILEMVTVSLCNHFVPPNTLPDASPPAPSSALKTETAAGTLQTTIPASKTADERWTAVVKLLHERKEMLLISMFQDARTEYNTEKNMLTVSFPAGRSFAITLAEQHRTQWEPLLKQMYSASLTITLCCDSEARSDTLKNNQTEVRAALSATRKVESSSYTSPAIEMLQKHFPGTITPVQPKGKKS